MEIIIHRVNKIKELKYEKALQSLRNALKEDPTNPAIIQNIKICNATIEKTRFK